MTIRAERLQKQNKKAASVGNGSRLLKKKMKKKIARKKSGDVGVFVAGRLLGRVETGDDVRVQNLVKVDIYLERKFILG